MARSSSPPPSVVTKKKLYISKHNPTAPPTASTFLGCVSLPGNIAGNTQPTQTSGGRQQSGGVGRGCTGNTVGKVVGGVAGVGCGGSGVLCAKLSSIHKEEDGEESQLDKCKDEDTSMRQGVMKEKKKAPLPKEHAVLHRRRNDRNFITSNALDVILAVPAGGGGTAKEQKEREENERGGGITKESYGKVPKYLSVIKKEIQEECEYINKIQQQKQIDQEGGGHNSGMKLLSESERLELREKLTKRWEELNREYQTTTHIIKLDTIGKIKRKEYFENSLTQIEKDLDKINKKYIFVNQN
eukprot:GHVQ01005311.1.p1 GENE.GHVQ01005311.1~~GHVQ01005311.1.p1  ORF type:complete len:299 (+),score=83.30 GHVQ01005311.1:288-1184(+)